MASAVLRTPPLDDLHRKGAPHASSKKSYAGNLHQDSLSSTTSSGNNGQGDLARILEPAMKKLATVESQRVLSVVDECNKKMQVLSSIPVFIKQPSRYSVSLGSDIMKQLEDHRQLTSEYRDALRAMGERIDSIENLAASTSQLSITDSVSSVLSSTPPKPRKLDPLNPRSRSAEELTELLKQSGRSLLRSFLRHPSAMSVVKGLGQEHMPSSCSSFLKELQILRGIEHEKLLTTQQEKENQKHQISTLSTKLQQTTSTVMQLEKELKTAEEIREEEKRKREALIEKLKSNISTVKKLSEESNHRVKTDAMKQKEVSKGVHNSRRTQMEEELGALQKQYKALLAENKQNEVQLRSVSADIRHDTCWSLLRPFQLGRFDLFRTIHIILRCHPCEM